MLTVSFRNALSVYSPYTCDVCVCLPPYLSLSSTKAEDTEPRGWVALTTPTNMMTSSNGNIFRVTGPLCVEFTGPGEFLAQRPVTRALMFSLICAWINDWINNREAGDLRRHRAHYDVIVMNRMPAGFNAAEVPVNFQSDWKSVNPNLAVSRLHEILRLDALPLSEYRPCLYQHHVLDISTYIYH